MKGIYWDRKRQVWLVQFRVRGKLYNVCQFRALTTAEWVRDRWRQVLKAEPSVAQAALIDLCSRWVLEREQRRRA